MRFFNSNLLSRLSCLLAAFFALAAMDCSNKPTTPVFTEILPGEVGTTLTPTVRGAAEAGTRVRVYRADDCTGAYFVDGADKFADAQGIAVTVLERMETKFSAQAFTADGESHSDCAKAAFTYLHDPDAPNTPIFMGTTPASPATSTTPTVHGLTEKGALVEIFLNSTCLGEPAEVTAADEDTGAFSKGVTVPSNATTLISARAQDGAGNKSACTAPGDALQYVHDSRAEVELTSIAPLSPSRAAMPVVGGNAEPGATVTIHGTAACDGSALGAGVANAAGQFSITAMVPLNQTTLLKAIAVDQLGNVSNCPESGLTYIHDTMPPSPPALTASQPVSPANENSPTILGTGEPGAQIELFASAAGDCAGPVVGTATISDVGSFATNLSASLGDDTSTLFSARATDFAGNISACSSQALLYVEDSNAQPVTFTGTSPVSPSSSASPRIFGMAEAGSTVSLYLETFAGDQCVGTAYTGTAEQFAATGIVVPVRLNSPTRIYGRVTDSVGNIGPCSTVNQFYQHDNIAPSRPVFDLAGGMIRNNDNYVRLEGDAGPWDAATMYVFPNQTCSGAGAAGYASINIATGDFRVTVSGIPDGTTVVYSGYSVDAAGNQSPCTNQFVTYVEDSTPPSVPTMLSVTPASPNNDTTPTFRVRTVPSKSYDAHEVLLYRSLYSTSFCTGLVATVEVPVSTASRVDVDITVSAPHGTTYYYSAKTRDEAGNLSPCTTQVIPYHAN